MTARMIGSRAVFGDLAFVFVTHETSHHAIHAGDFAKDLLAETFFVFLKLSGRKLDVFLRSCKGIGARVGFCC